MERRSRFFGALAGVGLLLGVPAYCVQKELEAVERGARGVLEAARAGQTLQLTTDRADRDVIQAFYNFEARYTRVEEYKVESVNTVPYGPSMVRGLVRRGNRWFRFSMVGNYVGRPYEYSEERVPSAE